MDFKPTILFIGTILISDVNTILTTSILFINLVYISYQLYTHHKKNK
jgi:hypothetical protein